MAIKKDMKDTPTKAQRAKEDGGWPPDEPDIMLQVAEVWYKEYLSSEEHPVDLPMAVEGAEFRASWGGFCLRRIQYQRAHFGVSDLPAKADAYRFQLGHDESVKCKSKSHPFKCRLKQ